MTDSAPSSDRQPLAGAWYVVVPIVSLGLLASVPFWHAFGRLRQRKLVRLAVMYTALPLLGLLLAGVIGNPPDDERTSFLEALPGLLFIAAIVGSVIQVRSVRREVFGAAGRAREARQAAVARTHAAKEAREQARALLASDPSAAWELGIGRPDLGRGYDDGGLVHLNTAPASVISQVCGIDLRIAQAIVDRRDAAGPFLSIGDVFVDVPVPPAEEGVLRDRAIV